MIDVVFVIMLFFMVMAGNVQVEKHHRTLLPSYEGPGLLPESIDIRIDYDGQVSLNDDPLDTPTSASLPELTNTLKRLRENSNATKSDLFVTIWAEETARYQRIVDTLDALSLANINQVTFQAGSLE
ncbi:MAG: biopolymer transporter ExbD [Gloeobacteraceae cyanobacterium ES-bin-144]|nr:biopolymer transporter ExbD [Verrucomicrobiales bacterium]